MTFTTVPATVTGDKYRASQHNTYVKDNLTELWKYTAAGSIVYANSATTLRETQNISGSYFYANESGVFFSPYLGNYSLQIKLVEDNTDVTVGAGSYFFIPESMNGRRLSTMYAYVTTAGTTGNTVISVRNMTAYPDVDIASTPPVILSGGTRNTNSVNMDANYYQVATNDKIYVFVGLVSVTPPKGLQVFLLFS